MKVQWQVSVAERGLERERERDLIEAGLNEAAARAKISNPVVFDDRQAPTLPRFCHFNPPEGSLHFLAPSGTSTPLQLRGNFFMFDSTFIRTSPHRLATYLQVPRFVSRGTKPGNDDASCDRERPCQLLLYELQMTTREVCNRQRQENLLGLEVNDPWFDPLNRLITLFAGGATTTYAYGAFGNRVSQATATTTFRYPNKFYSVDGRDDRDGPLNGPP
jgi:YD repeat-containing protein